MIEIKVVTIDPEQHPHRGLAKVVEEYAQERARNSWTLRSTFVHAGLIYLIFAKKVKG